MKLQRFALSALSTAIIAASPVIEAAEAPLEEIVVTARKRDELYVDVPVTTTVFTATEIEAAGIQKPVDFIALTPNVTLVQTQNQGNSFVTARGISQNRNTEMSVAVLMDGVLMVNPAQFNQELFDIEQIEVLKGPQGALYGRNAIGGAIVIQTREPTAEREGAWQIGGDSGPGIRVQGNLSGPVREGSDDFKFRISGAYKDTDGFIDNPFLGEKADPFRDTSVRLRLLWDPSADFRADFRASYSLVDTQALYYNIRSPKPGSTGLPISLGHGAGDPDSVNDTSLPVRVNNAGVNERDLSNLSLKLDWTLGSGTTFTSITSRDSLTEVLTGDAFDFVPIPESIGVAFGYTDANQSQFLTTDSLSQEFRLTSPGEERLRWIVGTYMVATDRFISTGNMVDTGQGVEPVYYTPRGNFPYDFANDSRNPQTTFLADAQDNFAWAVFGELAYDISDRTEAAFSLRYDDDERENTTRTPTAFLPNVAGFPQGFTGEKRTKSWDEWQPKFTIRFKPEDNISWYGSLSRGFRSGGFNQTGVGPIAAANGFAGVGDTFDAEVVDTIEAGFKGQFDGGRIRTNVSVYKSEAEGTYFFIFLATNSTQNLGSLKEVEYQGFEVDLTATLNSYFDLNLGFGLTDSEITASDTPSDIGNRAPNVSDYTFNLGLNASRPLAGHEGVELFGRVDYQIIGETAFFDREQADTNDRDAVNLVDVRTGFQVPGDWTATLWAKNLFDEEYNAEYSTGGFVFKGAPRTWGIDFMQRF